MRTHDEVILAPGLRYFSAAAVSAKLTPERCIPAMRDALIAASQQRVVQPPRSILPLPHDGGLAVMPGYLDDMPHAGVKVAGRFALPGRPGRHQRAGVFLLFDHVQGELRAVVDAGSLTSIRTAAATVAATQALARGGRRTVCLLGSGSVAREHVRAFSCDADTRRIVIWSRNARGAQALAGELAPECDVAIEVEADVERAVRMADVVCTLTSSPLPILQGAWLREGQHVNAVGSSTAGEREIDTDAVTRCRVYVDSREAAAKAAGELLQARAEGAIGDDHVVAEVGAVMDGRAMGRRAEREITLFKSLGLFAQDCIAAALLLE